MSGRSGGFAKGDAVSSAEESVDAALKRIAAVDGQLGAFIEVIPDRALADARHLDELVRRGVPRGPLFGVPIGVKDVIDVAGLPTRGGSLTLADADPATRSAPVVERLAAAGAVVVGKTRTVEFAFGGWGTNETVGTPLNPWDLRHPRAPGGSSSGSGVAVASGLVPLALGTDTGGSVRLPASFCGTVGLKTTAGLVDKSGALTLTDALDTIGPLTRHVAEAALALSIMADPGRLRGGDLTDIAAGQPQPIAGMRIGVPRDFGTDLHRDTARAFDMTLRWLEEFGAVVVEVDLGKPLAALTIPCGYLLSVESYLNFGHFAEEEPSRMGAAVRKRMLTGKDQSAPAYLAVLQDRAAVRRLVGRVFDDVQAIVTPTTPTPAPTIAELDENVAPSGFTRFANYAELAAVSVPVDVSSIGLPIGFQINVPAFHEPRALTIAAHIEKAANGPLIPRGFP